MSVLPENAIEIVLHPRRFDVRPAGPLPRVQPPWTPLLVAVDWSGNEATWQEVVLRKFSVAPSGRTELRFPENDERAIPIHFPRVREERVCTFEIHYLPREPSGGPFVREAAIVIAP